jgi:PilZ domain-containing protein
MTPWRRIRGPGETPPSTMKRRDERYLVNSVLTATREAADRKLEVHGRALDISENGVGGLFSESWTVGSRVNLEISLPVGRSPLKLDAIVRHRTGVKFRYGFEFVDMSLEQRRILQDACNFLASRKAGTDLR